MSYGIEVFNENGELVFSSLRRIMLVHAGGSVTLQNLINAITINFPPTERLPTLWLSHAGYNVGIDTPSCNGWPGTEMYCPMGGEFEKNSDGLWYRCKIKFAYYGCIPGDPEFIRGLQNPPVTVSYAILI